MRHAHTEAGDALRRLEALRREEPVAPASALIYALTLNRLEHTDEAMALLETTAQQARALGSASLADPADGQPGRRMPGGASPEPPTRRPGSAVPLIPSLALEVRYR